MIAFALVENGATILDDRLPSLPDALLPADKRERIARLGLVWTLKLKLLERRLYESVRLLADAGIEVTLLKGAAMALTVYPGFGDRPMADIDLLVDATRAREAHELMQRSGWKLDNGNRPADGWDGHHHLQPLLDTRGSGLGLELHVAPIPPGHPFQFDLAAVKASSQVIQADGIAVRVLELHMHAVHAAIHFAWCHQFATGGTNVLRDLIAIERTVGFSWERFISVARQTRSQTSCYWTLRLARCLTDLRVPDDVLTALAPDMSAPLLSVLERHFAQLVLRSPHACPSVALRHRLWAFALQAESTKTNRAAHWEVGGNGPQVLRKLRRVPSNIRRIHAWSLYVRSLFPGAWHLGARAGALVRLENDRRVRPSMISMSRPFPVAPPSSG